MSYRRAAIFLFALTSFFPLHASSNDPLDAQDPQPEKVSIKISPQAAYLKSLIKAKKYREAGCYLKKRLGKTLSVRKIKKLSTQINCPKLKNAINAACKMVALSKNRFSLNLGQAAQSAFFIETELPSFIKKKARYLASTHTGLCQTLEYDPKRKCCFLVFKGKKFHIGEGAKKIVRRSIRYDRKNPELLACAEQGSRMSREYKITKLMKNTPGIFDTRALSRHKKRGKTFTTIYSKIYNTGSLQNAFDKKKKLTLFEKMKVALNILTGLEALHKKGIAHRDLGARNYLIHIPRKKPGRRNVEAVIADLGRANYVTQVRGDKANGNTSYIPPEGMFPKKIVGEKCFKADVFAVGNVFYELFYGKPAPWRKARYFKDRSKSASKKYKVYVKDLKTSTHKRRKYLAQKKLKEAFTQREEFESLILQMVNPDPKKRGSAANLKQKMKSIFLKQKQCLDSHRR